MEDIVSAGLGAGPTSPRPYIYLIYDSAGQPLSKELKDAYYGLGVSTGDDSVFILVDNHTDGRVREALSQSEEGIELYEKISGALPCFVFADGRLKLNFRLKRAEVQKISNKQRDIEFIYDRLGLHAPTTRQRAANYLRDVNRVLRLNPNLFGIGVDINAFLSILIDKLDKKDDPH